MFLHAAGKRRQNAGDVLTGATNVDGAVQNEYSSERKSSSVLSEITIHLFYAADKIVWTKFGGGLRKKEGVFVPVRVGK